jgi:hypothetical protein
VDREKQRKLTMRSGGEGRREEEKRGVKGGMHGEEKGAFLIRYSTNKYSSFYIYDSINYESI